VSVEHALIEAVAIATAKRGFRADMSFSMSLKLQTRV
jgi:hypothetical protein